MNGYSRIAVAFLLLLVLCTVAGSQSVSAAPEFSEISYSIGPGVSDEDEAYVREGIALGSRYALTFGSGQSESDLIVNVRETSFAQDSGTTGFTSPGFMTIFTDSRGWNEMTAQRRVQVVVHEFIHVVEFTWLVDVQQVAPQWFVEGLAEYLSHDALIREGMLKQQDVQDYFTWSVNEDENIPPLKSLVDYDAFYEVSGSYQLSYLAIDYLVQLGSTESVIQLLDELEDGAPWELAFARAFDLDSESFYASFASFRAQLYAPSTIPASFQDGNPLAIESGVRITSIAEQVKSGDQLVVLGRAEPNAVCVFSLARGSSVPIVIGATFADPAGQLFWILSIPNSLESGPATVAVVCGLDPDSENIAINE